MRSKMRILSILFVLGFVFAFTFSVGLQASDPPPIPPGVDCDIYGADGSCCIDSQGRHGFFYGYICVCGAYPEWPTVGGPCNCQIDLSCLDNGNQN